MTRSCPLCEQEAAAYEVYGAHLDATDRDDRIGYVASKRDLEDALERRLTVARIKRHLHERIVYVFDPSEPTADDLRGVRKVRGQHERYTEHVPTPPLGRLLTSHTSTPLVQ